MGVRTAGRHASPLLARCRPAVLCRVIAAVTLVASLAACGAGTPSVSLPPKQSSAPAAAAPSVAAATSSKQAVITAYLAFWPASDQAEKTGNAAAARAILGQYVDSNYVGYMISGMQSDWTKNEVNWGASVEHIQAVTVATFNSGAQTAVVKDCQDDSHDGLANAKTGALVQGTLGAAHQELYASLSLVSGHWLIEQVTFVGATCAG